MAKAVMAIRSKVNSVLKTEQSKNIFLLMVVQAVNYIFPIFITPFLVRKLGVDGFGQYSFVVAVVIYFGVIVDFAFSLSGVRGVSKAIESICDLSEVFNDVQTSKAMLMVFTTVIFLIGWIPLSRYVNNFWLYLAQYLLVCVSAFTPVFFFQGIEKLGEITRILVIGKVITAGLLLALVKGVDDIVYVPSCFLLGNCIVLTMSYCVIIRKYKVSVKINGMLSALACIKRSAALFMGMSFASLYRETIPVILGMTSSMENVGYYVLAEKIIKGLQSLQSPFGQALFPYLSKKQSPKAIFGKLNDYAPKVFCVLLAISLMVFVFADEIIYLAAGNELDVAKINLRILALVICFGGLNYYYGFLGFLPSGKERSFLRIVKVTGLVTVPISYILCVYLQGTGASIAMVTSELIMFFMIASELKVWKTS